MVEWKTIGEITNIVRGNRITKSELLDNGIYPVISGGVTPLGYIDKYNREPNTITIAQYGSAGYIDYQQKKFWANDVCYSVYPKSSVDNKYLFYALVNKQYDIYSLRTNAVPAHLPLKSLQDVKIPTPSLEEQNRIVGILDTFTDSIENLKQQIAQRRKQYEHYRDQLLELEGKEGVEWKKLNTVCEVINGRAYKQQELLATGKYRVLRVGNFFSNDSWYFSDLELDDKYYCNEGDLLYAWSASFGPHIWTEEKTIYHYHIWKMNCSEELDKKFMFYWLQSENMRKQAFSHLHGATMAHLTKALMESLNVPLLPLSGQQRIVSILDTFEANISNLEAQLAQRQKQYEYYRNQLLTFE
jgi:type I restriction enzyme S subunit